MKAEITNPWPKIIKKENHYCLEDDYNRIGTFNKDLMEKRKDENGIIDLSFIAEPFFGNLNAKVVFLALNPGIYIKKKESEKDEKNLYEDCDRFKADIVKYHNGEEIEYPYYYLNPKYKDYPGNIWIEKKLKHLKIEFALKKNWIEIGIKELEDIVNKKVNMELSTKILYLQYFPYHSKEFKKIPGNYLESQKYTFHLLAKAIKRDALIVCFRSFDFWKDALYSITNGEQDLMDYEKKKKLICLKNPRNPALTKRTVNKNGRIILKGNMEDEQFEALIKKLLLEVVKE
jgi:hypothetical protein